MDIINKILGKKTEDEILDDVYGKPGCPGGRKIRSKGRGRGLGRGRGEGPIGRWRR